MVRLVMRQGAMLTLLGVAGGLLAAAAGTRLLRGMLFAVAPLDPVTFLGGAALLLGIAALACYLPARRAGRTDPVAVLRTD